MQRSSIKGTIYNILSFILISMIIISCDSFKMKQSDLYEKPHDSDKIIISKSSWGIDHISGFDSLGFNNRDTVPNIILYSSGEAMFDLYSELDRGIPILLVSASYSCGPSQKNLPRIDNIEQRFDGQISVYLVQIVESHPIDTISPYSHNDRIWTTKGRKRDKQQIHQPRTYGERKDLSRQWIKECDINTQVLLDSRDNSFWNEFGQAPHIAYLINTDRTVYHRQSWFKANEMTSKISALLNQ